MEGLFSYMIGNLLYWIEEWSLSVMSDSLQPVNCSPPGPSVHGILQARILEWVAISFSRGSSRPRNRTQVSHIAGRPFNLCAAREALKYKNTVSQKTSKISREERKPGWKKKGEEVGEGVQKGWPYRCLLPPTDTQALWDFTLGLQRTRPYQKSDQTRTRIRVLCQEEVISLQSSA